MYRWERKYSRGVQRVSAKMRRQNQNRLDEPTASERESDADNYMKNADCMCQWVGIGTVLCVHIDI